jgi:Na+/H+-dicarboxylate symporter
MSGVLKNYRFSLILLAGVLVGAVLGIILGPKASVLQPFANVFLNIVFCIIIPLVFVSISNSIAGMVNLRKLGKTLSVLVGVIVATGLISSFLALLTVFIFNPSQGATLDLSTSFDASTTNTAIQFDSILTVPNFTDLLSLSHMLPLIIFSILTGIAVGMAGEEGVPVANLLKSATAIIGKFVQIIMYYAPVGIACYFASLIGSMGAQVIGSIVRLSIIYSVFCVLYVVIFHSCTAFVGGGKEGLKRYWKHIWLPMATAAGTCSSSASMPANIVAAENMGIPKETRDLVIPLAGLIHKDGVVIVQIMKIVFLFGALGLDFTASDAAKAVLVALISGMIVGTIPSGGFIGEMFICTTFGLPIEAVPILVIMGTITDPFCTTTSVTSQPAIAMVVAKLTEGKKWIGTTFGMKGEEVNAN